jgi:preprotein translocase subunit SecB
MTEQTSAQEPQFMIQRVFLKDLSFEAPTTPSIFKDEWKPEMTLDLNTEHSAIEDKVYEVVLSVHVTVKNQDKVAFIVELKQAGIFTIEGAANEQLDHLLKSFCPTILFPYAREAVTDAVVKGSFPQLVLAPVNFDALYMQQKQQAGQTQ